jgi:hypothetical protein
MIPERVVAGVVIALGIALTPLEGAALTRYHVRLATSSEQSAWLVLEFTCNDSSANRATLFGLTHDGTRGGLSLTGGPVTGDILSGANPADKTSVEAAAFFSEIRLQLSPLGTFANFDLDMTENPATADRAADEFSFFYMAGENAFPYPTADALGANALFVVEVTGEPGGDLAVFSPMTFVPPDTLRLDVTLVSVPAVRRVGERLRFKAIFPNPASRTVRFDFEVPTPGGAVRLRIFDVVGRLVAEPLNELRAPGRWNSIWSGMGHGGDIVAPGVYLAQLQFHGQTRVRRFALTR